MLFPVADIHMYVCTYTYFERSNWVWDDHTVPVFEIGKYKLLLCSPALFSIQMYSTMLAFWHFGQKEPSASSMYGELIADFTYSCQGRDVLTATNSNKLTPSHLCSFCSWELSCYISRSCHSPFSIYSFHCFMPPKNEWPGLLLSLLWWTLSVTPSSLFLKIMSSFHTTGIFLGLVPSLSAQCPLLQLAACWVIIAPWHPSPSNAHSWVKAETRKYSEALASQALWGTAGHFFTAG